MNDNDDYNDDMNDNDNDDYNDDMIDDDMNDIYHHVPE